MIPSTWLGVDYVGQLFASFEFRKPACDKGIAGLEAYRRQKNTSDGVVRDEPVHDWASHIADAVRTMAEADKAGLISSARNNGATVHRPQPAAITRLSNVVNAFEQAQAVYDREPCARGVP
jgi:hypothetical protein